VRDSVFLNHHFSGFYDGSNGVALFEFQFVGAAPRYGTLDEIFADSYDHMSHHVAQLNFFDLSAEFVSG